MSTPDPNKTLRLLFPQWQGGNNPPYFLGAQLLNWLAPHSDGPFAEVPVSLSLDEQIENGIFARQTLLSQARAAKNILLESNPDRVVVLGGDCSVELAPFSYLIEKYNGDVAVLWVDAHPDVSVPEDFENHHAHVLANLLGIGDKEFVAEVSVPIKSDQVMYVGLNDMLDALSTPLLNDLQFEIAGPEDIAKDSTVVLRWLKKKNPSKVIVHFDLDVLDLREFRSLLIAYPGTYEKNMELTPKGSSMETIIRVMQDVARNYDIVGLGITEHFPWDSYFLANMLSRLPLLGDIERKDTTSYHTLA